MDDLKQTIQDNNPNLKQSSINQYICNVKKTLQLLEGGLDDPSNTINNRSEEIIEAIETMNENTQKNKLNAILKVVNADSIASKNYKDRRDLLQSRYNDRVSTGEKTEKEEARMITREQYDFVLNSLHEKIDGLDKSDLPLKKNQWKYWLGFMLLSLYKEIP